MNSKWKHASLKTFIRDTLGCRCPDEVFQKIEVDRHAVNDYPYPLSRIVVGDTLLIYIVHPAVQTALERHIKTIASAGKSDRDSHNYNRFRLVISTLHNSPQSDRISQQFNKHFAADEKMHIHYINETLLNDLKT